MRFFFCFSFCSFFSYLLPSWSCTTFRFLELPPSALLMLTLPCSLPPPSAESHSFSPPLIAYLRSAHGSASDPGTAGVAQKHASATGCADGSESEVICNADQHGPTKLGAFFQSSLPVARAETRAGFDALRKV